MNRTDTNPLSLWKPYSEFTPLELNLLHKLQQTVNQLQEIKKEFDGHEMSPVLRMIIKEIEIPTVGS